MSDSAPPSHGDERPWIAVRIEGAVRTDLVSEVLFEAGSLGVQDDGGSVITHFAPGHDVEAVTARVREVDPAARVTVSEAPPADWSAWRASVNAHRLGKLTISPPWLADLTDPDVIVIDPAMAFGTGEHATTRGVVRLMQELPAMPEMVADIGAGSAVLAICAARLGAKRVVAIELDHDAIGNALENVEANRLDASVHVMEGDAGLLLPLVAPVGLVLANIISSVLLELLPVIHDSLVPRGYAILSGILVDERQRMLEAVGDAWTVLAEDKEEGWWSVLIERQR